MIEGWLLLLLMLASALAGLGAGYVAAWTSFRETKRCLEKTLGDALDSSVKQTTREQKRADRYSDLCRRVEQWRGTVVLDEHAKPFEALRDEIRSAIRTDWLGPDLDETGRSVP